MLYHIANWFPKLIPGLHAVTYISTRAICALLSALFISLISGKWFIQTSHSFFRSNASNRAPKHHQKKNGTPTMGGLFVVSVCLLNVLLWNNLSDVHVWFVLLTLITFGCIGLIDDWYKITQDKGIKAYTKFILQWGSAAFLVLGWYLMMQTPNIVLCIPLFKQFSPQLGWWLIPWGIFIIVATSNAVNLTDGLDGLATGPLICAFTAFSIIAYLAGHSTFAAYLHIPFAGTSEVTIIGATLIGALLGFLWYNTYPAQIFMGDVGSLALGATLASIALTTRQELLLPLAGGIFVLETVSVIVQVASFKLLGQRIFKMAPIHHHFELLGWQESKITTRFWIIAGVLMLFTVLTLKLR